MRVRQLVVIPGGCGVGGERELIGQVDTGIELRAIRAEVEAQYLRKQNYAVEVEVAFGFEHVGKNGGARGAVAFAEQIFRRVPASIFREELNDEIGKGVRILIDAVEGLFAVLAADAAEAGAGRVDEDEIAGIEQAEIVVDDRVGRGGRVRIISGDDAPGPECSHVEPHGGRARAAVVEESHRALRVLAVGFEVRDVEHAGFGGLVLGVLVRIILRDVVPALGMDDESTGKGVVSDRIPTDGDGAFARLLLGLEVFRRLSRFRLADRRLGCCLRMNDRRMKRRDRNRGDDPQNEGSHRAYLCWRNHLGLPFMTCR